MIDTQTLCINCQNSNRKDSKFCRFCGTILSSEKGSDIVRPAAGKQFSITLPSLSSIWQSVRNLRTKVVIAVAIIIAISGTAVFAAPKVSDYLAVGGAIKNAETLSSNGDFQAALDSLDKTSGRWSTTAQKASVASIKEQQEQYLKDKSAYDDAVSKISAKNLKGAREALQTIGEDYPKFSEVTALLSELQGKIEGELEEKASAANTARAAAERRAQAETAAKAQAEAQQAASEAQARASAQSARDSEARAQAEAAQRAAEVLRSFRSQLTGAYNSYNQAMSYYSSGISYSNSGDSILALTKMTAARAALNSAAGSSGDLNTRFTGMPSDYYTAASNMNAAISWLNKAIDLVVASEGTSLDYSSIINSDKNLAWSYYSLVGSFLNSH